MTSIIKHYKKISVLLLMAYVISLLIPLKVFAGDVLWDSYEIPAARQKDRVYDAADLLTDSEEKSLLSTLDELSNKWQCNIIVLTTDSHNGSIQACADDYFDYNGDMIFDLKMPRDARKNGFMFSDGGIWKPCWAVKITGGEILYNGKPYVFKDGRWVRKTPSHQP